MKKIGSFLIFVFLLIFQVKVYADVTVQATVDKNEIGLNDTLTLMVTVISKDSVEIQDPQVPNLDGFELVNSWDSMAVSNKLVQTDQGMQFETIRRKEFNYILGPQREGQLSIDTFELVVDGKVYRTQPILIKVTKDSPSSGKNLKPKAQGGANPFGLPNLDDLDEMDRLEQEMFNQLLQRRRGFQSPPTGGQQGGGSGPEIENPQFRTLPKDPNQAFFIQVEVDKTEVFEGEQIRVNWFVYTRGQMETLDRLKFPSLRGFWKEVIEEVPSIQFVEEVVNGVPYRKALLASHAIFPIKAGKLVIDEYKIKSRVRLNQSGFGFGFGPAYEYTRSSERVNINVKPLPMEGRPKDFSGAVGQFEMQSIVEGKSYPMNQPFSLRIRYEGVGNAKLIELPALNLPQELEVYDTKSESKFFKDGRSYKEFEVLIIPRKEGAIEIPSLSTGFFDSITKKYYSKTTVSIPLTITASITGAVPESSKMMLKPAEKKNELVLPEIVQTWESGIQIGFLNRYYFWLLSFLGVVLVLFVKAQREFNWFAKQKEIKDIVEQKFKAVEALMKKNDYRNLGAELTNLFYFVLGGVSKESGLDIMKVLEAAPASVRRKYQEQILKSFEYFQTLSFAPEEMITQLKDPKNLKEQMAIAKKLLFDVIKEGQGE